MMQNMCLMKTELCKLWDLWNDGFNHEIDCYCIFNWSVHLIVNDVFMIGLNMYAWVIVAFDGMVWISPFYKCVFYVDSEKKGLEGIICMKWN